jgi:hypothetical protein
MKKRFWIYFLILGLAILAILFWRQSATQSIITTPAQVTMQPSTKPNVIHPGSNISGTLQNPTTQPQIQTTNSRLEFFKREFEAKNASVSFYGRVVDQQSNDIAGVQILMSVRQWGIGGTFDSWGNKFPKFERTTDSNGNFSLENVNGDSLTIESITKEGYLLSPKIKKGYGFGNVSDPFHPDQQNPVIIKMWKELGATEPLITGSHVFGMDSGKTYTVDLIHGKKTEGDADGDLIISIKRPDEVNSRDRYSWSYSIEAINGGLIETDDEFMYLAPESGYYPKIEKQFDPTDSDWNFDIAKQFFIRTRGGQIYGRVQIVFHSVYNVHSAIEINYAINPTGSRNLQP